ncbi:glycosyltransferase family 2 protein [Methanomethylovorans sp.]|uniref:glycosyltransferase n=1 Tax=Methanomethylovorans sp. TaxID=2758717 RepID=UPI000A60B101|nr:glycosyltransferase [Methanomethylovorans sp.]
MATLISLALTIFVYLITFESFMYFICSVRHYTNSSYKKYEGDDFVSIIVPCYNEELTLINCIKSMVTQTYNKYEIIIVDDGSTDGTLDVAKSLLHYKNVVVLTKPNAGKASALNFGIKHCRGNIVVCVDADSIFLSDTLLKLLEPFSDSKVAAVSGNVKVANRENVLGKNQALEYILGLNLHRRMFTVLNCVPVIPGAIGAFRKDVVLEVGGYSLDTLVEDMDLTMAISKLGYKIEFVGEAIAYTEAPESYKDFCKQRYRWTYGTFEVINKYKSILFNYKSGKELGVVGLPYIIFSTFINILITLAILYLVINLIFYGNSSNLMPLFFTMFVLQNILILYTIHIDREDLKLLFYWPFQVVIYRQIIYFITIKALINYMRGKKTSWNKLDRLGKNMLKST